LVAVPSTAGASAELYAKWVVLGKEKRTIRDKHRWGNAGVGSDRPITSGGGPEVFVGGEGKMD